MEFCYLYLLLLLFFVILFKDWETYLLFFCLFWPEESMDYFLFIKERIDLWRNL